MKIKHIKPLKKNKHMKSFEGQIWQCKYRKKHRFKAHKFYVIKALVALLKHKKALTEWPYAYWPCVYKNECMATAVELF